MALKDFPPAPDAGVGNTVGMAAGSVRQTHVERVGNEMAGIDVEQINGR